MNFGLNKKTLLTICNYFARQPEIAKVKIYGSRAMGKCKKGSDIDLAIYTVKGIGDITGRILTELNELPTPYFFDVTDYRHISHQPLKKHIDQRGKLIYSK